MKIGVNTWVWSSPLTTDEFARLAAHIAGMGFDLIEVPIETPGEFDYARAGAVARDHGLGITVCAAMSPDRDLIHPDGAIRTNGMDYVRHCIEAAEAITKENAANDRVWRPTSRCHASTSAVGGGVSCSSRA